MVVTESHERASYVNLREIIQTADRVGRLDPHLSPVFPEGSVYRAQFENTNLHDFETKEGRLGTYKHFVVYIVETAVCTSQWPSGFSGYSGGQTKGWTHRENLNPQTKSLSKE